ncbi:MAG: hypothetical protein HY513_00565 [Candidatus Aenigmarchaeota archaeon]|nr:hypothetical protein [Candidatus Aenigmarchaeota archaeon]
MADPFTVLVQNLNALGVFGFLLPWVFVFVVVYALLMKSKFSEDKRLIGVLSLVVAFFSIGFGGPPLANFFVSLFGFGTLIIALIFIIILFLAMTGRDISKIGDTKTLTVVAAGIGIIIFSVALGGYGVNITDSVIGILFIIIVLAIAIMFVTGNSGS